MNGIRKLAFIGGGNMAAALISGLMKRGMARESIVVADPNAQRREHLIKDHGIAAMPENASAVRDADVVILAVKPQQMRIAAANLAPHLIAQYPLVISIAAGIPHAVLAQWLGPRVPVVRTMPNQPALNGLGATGLYAPDVVGAPHRIVAESIMNAVGITAWVDRESQLDTITALSGSGPAYFFLFIEALEAAAVARGLPAAIARRFTLETAFGAAQMARQATLPPAALREQVTSEGGTTAAALQVLDVAGLRAIVASALTAADRRSAQLAAEFGAINP